jgi:hypothetical protein
MLEASGKAALPIVFKLITPCEKVLKAMFIQSDIFYFELVD